MRTSLVILFIIGSATTGFAQQPDTISFKKIDWRLGATKTKYKAGLTYYDRYTKVTLIRWVDHSFEPSRPNWRWEATFEVEGCVSKGYVDDINIDIVLGKAIRWKGKFYEPIEKQ